MIDVVGIGLGTALGALGSIELVAAGSGRRASPWLGLGLVTVGAVLAYVAQRQRKAGAS
jgi:hypothetical protein